jgi:AcrR family transcriptional regulator
MTDEVVPGSPGRGAQGRGWAPREARIALARRLRARRSEIDEAIFARISDQWFDQTGSDDPEYVAGLRAAGVAALDYILEGIEHSGGSLGRVPVATLEQARRAARTGVGLETVLRRYLAGYSVLASFVVEEAERAEQDRVPPTHGLREMLANMSALVDRLITAVSRAYGEEIEGAGHAPSPPPARAAPGRVVGPRRDRILQAMVEMAAERGFENTTVVLLTERAGVSTRTFYEEFGDLQECFEAVLDLALERAGGLIAQAFMREQRWQDGVLAALASLLVFFDSEPALTQVWFVDAMSAGSWALARREQIAAGLRTMIIEHWATRGEQAPEPVAAAGVMASVLGLIQTHLVTEQPEPLIELLGPLMGLVTSLYLDTQDRAREVQRGAQLAREIQAGEDARWTLPAQDAKKEEQGPVIPATLANPSARRARECLLFLAEQDPRGVGPSNREIAAAIGVSHEPQISRVLSHLAEEKLVTKRSAGAGKRNAWRLTPRGEEIVRALTEQED